MSGYRSIVEFMPEYNGYSCGYCKSSDTNYSDGLWAHSMTVHDYQDLIDRGWRRSGQYCYKPLMKVTCCPLYTIKCEALNFKLSKSQKKILKKMSRFLIEGEEATSKFEKVNDETEDVGSIKMPGSCTMDVPNLEAKALNAEKHKMDAFLEETSVEIMESGMPGGKECAITIPVNSEEKFEELVQIGNNDDVSVKPHGSSGFSLSSSKTPKTGVGRDFSKPICKKAKSIRLERKAKKLEAKGMNVESLGDGRKKQQEEKSLEDFLNPLATSPAHRLEVRLIPCEFDETELKEVIWPLYVRYQMTVHNETEKETTFDSFYSFLVASPLKPWKENNSTDPSYGSFHQQYWLDGKLIAVGVLDILPHCVSSVYFFYDPDYSHLTLGTYGSLREVAFVRSLNKKAPGVKFYYMGYYVHSCPKMRYKASLQPSFLLCPETLMWVPVEKAVQKLDVRKYSRLMDDDLPIDPPISIDKVLVLWKHIAMPFSVFRVRNTEAGRRVNEDVKEVSKYISLVGPDCAQRMLLFRQ